MTRVGKDYLGTKFFYTEPLSLNKAHSTKWKAFNSKTLYLYNHSYEDQQGGAEYFILQLGLWLHALCQIS